MIPRPSDNLNTCEACHQDIVKTYKTSLHYTTSGLSHGVAPRFSPSEYKEFKEKVFEKSCRSCHAACGDCHVRIPNIGGVKLGLIKNHQFVKRDEAKTCGLCHGGRVYPEFNGEYGMIADVHYQKGMGCVDCHNKKQLHGDGKAYMSRKEVRDKPSCTGCHKIGNEQNEKAKIPHITHKEKLSCGACHAAAQYVNCRDCHLGAGAKPERGFILGKNPRKKDEITTLRVIPTSKETFKPAGIIMSNFDALPNYWDTTPHKIRKRTERTRSCDVCHVDNKNFLTRGDIPPNSPKANFELIYTPKPVTK